MTIPDRPSATAPTPISTVPFAANGRDYRPPPAPVVVICLDGCADEYLNAALLAGRMPRVEAMLRGGYRGLVRGALPSFTNVNNAAIVTGVPPSRHGISGNYFFDAELGEEVMMNAARYLRAETILAAAERTGRRVAMVTAKEKLRDMLSAGLTGPAFSAECAGDATAAAHGIDGVEILVGAPAPPIYSAEASLFVLRSGVKLVEAARADLLYLSLTDYMQHKFAPHAPEALEFYAGIDREIGHLLDLGAVVGATADHGMNAKNRADGGPNVIYVETLLADGLGVASRVICPITDPYVVHHGALGSLVWVHLAEPGEAAAVGRWLLAQPGICEVHDRASAARKLELPADRIGDLVVLAGRDVVLGRTPEHHDLAPLEGSLRSHGGRYEEMVPMLLSRPLGARYLALAGGDPRNFDIFDFTLNGAAA